MAADLPELVKNLNELSSKVSAQLVYVDGLSSHMYVCLASCHDN